MINIEEIPSLVKKWNENVNSNLSTLVNVPSGTSIKLGGGEGEELSEEDAAIFLTAAKELFSVYQSVAFPELSTDDDLENRVKCYLFDVSNWYREVRGLVQEAAKGRKGMEETASIHFLHIMGKIPFKVEESFASSAGRMPYAARELIAFAKKQPEGFNVLENGWLDSVTELANRYFVTRYGEWDADNGQFEVIPLLRCLSYADIKQTDNEQADIIEFLEYVSNGGMYSRILPERPVVPYESDGGASLKAAPARPSLTDEMKLAAALKTAKEIPNIDEDYIEDVASSIADRCCSGGSGYEIAKELESWNVDIEFDTMTIEALDLYSHFVGDEIKEAGKEWVKENGIKPQFELGARVSWRGHEGVIVGSDDHYPARYKVRTDDQKENESYLVEYEVVALVEESK